MINFKVIKSTDIHSIVASTSNLILEFYYLYPLILGYVDSNSEDSDSDMSDVAELDSDIEREKEKDYDRAVYKEDLSQLKRLQKQQKNSNNTQQDGQKRNQAPQEGIKLEFIHGYVRTEPKMR